MAKEKQTEQAQEVNEVQETVEEQAKTILENNLRFYSRSEERRVEKECAI